MLHSLLLTTHYKSEELSSLTFTTFTGENIIITGGHFNAPTATQNDPLHFFLQTFGNNYVAGATHDNNDVLDAPKCHPGTRTSLLHRFSTWVKDLETSIYITWLHGPAGAGKSAIARSLAETLDDDCLLAGSFFFFKMDSMRNTEKPLVATLTYQIACNIPQTQPYIEKAISADPSICSRSFQTQFRRLILKPLELVLASESNSFVQPMLIIIDGLDECVDRKSRGQILKVVFDALPCLNGHIKFLIISRPEYDIQRSFDSIAANIGKHIELRADLQAYEDVRNYLRDKFGQIKQTHPLQEHFPPNWPSEHAIEQLVEKSSGYFIYAATVVKFIENDFEHPQERLDIIVNLRPTSQNPYAVLDALYLNILTSSKTNRAFLANIFSFVFLRFSVNDTIFLDNETTQTVRFVETVLFLRPGGVQLALLDLKSLVYVRMDVQTINFWHKSFSDFLLDASRSKEFHATSAHARTVIAKGCLQLLSDKTGLLQESWLTLGLEDPMVDCHYLLSMCCRGAVLDLDLQTDMMKYEFNIIPAPDTQTRARAFWILCRCLEIYRSASTFRGTKIVESLYHRFDCYLLSELRHFVPLDSAVMHALRAAVSPYDIDWEIYRKLACEHPSQFFNSKSCFLSYMDHQGFPARESCLCEFFYLKDHAGEYYLGQWPRELSIMDKGPVNNNTVSYMSFKSILEGQAQPGSRKRRRSISPDDDEATWSTVAIYGGRIGKKIRTPKRLLMLDPLAVRRA